MAASSSETTLKLGQTFSSFEDVKAAIARYEHDNFVNLYVADSRTIASSARRTPNKVYKNELKYSYVSYACVAGGKPYKSHSKGVRPNQRFVILCVKSSFL